MSTDLSFITNVHGKILKDRFECLISDLGQEPWFICTDAERRLREKIQGVGLPLKEWDVTINYGIKTGLNDAFLIDTGTRDRLVAEDPRSAEILKPVLQGRDIRRYGYDWAGKWLIATGFDTDVPNQYPAVYKHLLRFEERARRRHDQGRNWWNLRACAYYPEFERDKIAWIELADRGRFALVEAGVYIDCTVFLMTHPRANYLLGCLNSSLINWYFDTICASSGEGTNRWKKIYVERLPIPRITPMNEGAAREIEALADRITAAVRSGDDTTALEKDMDSLVYGLYGLTPEEIAVVEKKES